MKLLLALALAVAALSSACGASDTYRVGEVQSVFEGQGLDLHEGELPPSPTGTSINEINPWASGNTILVPHGDAPLFVFVGSATDAEDVWSMYASQQGADTFDARRANVVAVSDGGLTAPDRVRVKAALESLPDKGSAVVVSAGPG